MFRYCRESIDFFVLRTSFRKPEIYLTQSHLLDRNLILGAKRIENLIYSQVVTFRTTRNGTTYERPSGTNFEVDSSVS